MYIFYGFEIPKGWTKWPTDDEPVTISNKNWTVDVPIEGGEPLMKNRTVPQNITVNNYELTIYRYPYAHVDNIWTESSGILGFLICEIDPYSDPTQAMQEYIKWNQAHSVMTNFDTTLKDACDFLDFNFIQPKLFTTN